MIDNPYTFMKEFKRRGVFFSFNGPISDVIVKEIVDILKHILKSENAGTSTIFNLFSVVVELLQNMHYYSATRTKQGESDEDEKDMGLGMLFMGIENNDYFILCGNPISNHKIESLKQKLAVIRDMDKKQLRRYYKEKLKMQPDEDSRGAGLGLIEVAKKAAKPIEYNFQPIDDEISFFSFQTYVSRE